MNEGKKSMGLAACAAAALCLARSALAAVVTVPPTGYLEDFNDNTANDFVVAGFKDWGSAGADVTVTATGGQYGLHARSRTVSYGGANASAAIQLDLGSPSTSFTLSSKATPTLLTANNTSQLASMAIGALGSGMAVGIQNNSSGLFYSATGSFYRAEFVIAKGSSNSDATKPLGALKIYSVVNNVSTAVATGQFGETPSLNTAYDLLLQGTYSNGALTLAFTVDDPSSLNLPVTITSAPISSPLVGSYFGYGVSSGNGQTTVAFDNLLVAIPEPATAALAGLVGIGALARRRRA